MILKTFSLFVMLFWSVQIVSAQFTDSDFERYTVSDGLSDNNVTCIAQDHTGFMWIGTEEGLNSFNGETFERYFPHNKPLGIVGSYIVNLIQFNNNCLGLVTREGFQVINTESKTTRNYRFNNKDAFTHYNNYVYDAVELPGGPVLYSSSTGVYEFDKPGHISFRYDNYTASSPESKRILYAKDIVKVSNTEVLIYTAGYKLDYFDFQKKNYFHIPPASVKWKVFYPDQHHDTNCEKIAENKYIFLNPYSDSLIFYDRTRNLRVVSKLASLGSKELNWSSKVFMLNDSSFVINSPLAGFYLFELNKKTGTISGSPNKFLSSYKCNTFFLDKENRLWIGTRTGLLRQKKKSTFITTAALFNPQDAGSNARFTSVCRYRDKLYVGSDNRLQGLFIVDTASLKVCKTITFYGGDNGWSEIQSIQCYHKDTLWLGTSKGLLWFDVHTYQYGCVMDRRRDSVMAGGNPILLPVDKKGRAWLFDYMNGRAGYYDTTKRTFTFFTTTTSPALPFSRIKHVVYDAYGDVWLAGHGMARWNEASKQFDSFTKVYGGPNKTREDILAIAADKKGSLWLYNAENVLLEYKIKEKKFYPHAAAEGLPVFVQSMAEEMKDRLWFTTGNQLIGYSLQDKQVVSFDQGDGVPVERSSSRLIFYDKGRDCYYSVHDNYLAVFPAKIPPRQESTNHLLITKIVFADSTLYNPKGSLHVDYTRQNFSVHFTALNYDEPHSCNYYYNVDNSQWTSLEGLEVIAFNQLPPGNHLIQIKAVTKFGRSLVTAIKLIVIPPYWQRLWFIILLALAITGVLYAFYNYRVGQIIKLQAVRNDIARDLHDDIASTMGSINLYSEIASENIKKQQPVMAEEILQKIGGASRQMIEQMSDIVWSIDATNDYLENLTDRMKSFCEMTLTPAGINFQFGINAAFSGTSLPMDKRKNIFLVFKECIHNILKYAACKNVNITIAIHQNKMKLTVTDNGKGFDIKNGKAYNGNGLRNMKQRATALHGNLTIQSAIGEGTTVELQLEI